MEFRVDSEIEVGAHAQERGNEMQLLPGLTAVAGEARAVPPLSTNVPQQITYSGNNYIELRLPPGAFIASAQRSNGGGQ